MEPGLRENPNDLSIEVSNLLHILNIRVYVRPKGRQRQYMYILYTAITGLNEIMMLSHKCLICIHLLMHFNHNYYSYYHSVCVCVCAHAHGGWEVHVLKLWAPPSLPLISSPHLFSPTHTTFTACKHCKCSTFKYQGQWASVYIVWWVGGRERERR